MKKNTVRVNFKWVSLQPDRRQWKPSNPLLEPLEVFVGIDVPLDESLVTVSNKPVLTPLGMKYCIDRFEEVMKDQSAETTSKDDEEWEKVDDEKWE